MSFSSNHQVVASSLRHSNPQLISWAASLRNYSVPQTSKIPVPTAILFRSGQIEPRRVVAQNPKKTPPSSPKTPTPLAPSRIPVLSGLARSL